MVEDLRMWAKTFRRARSEAVANLLESAATEIASGRKNDALSVELFICASLRDDLPEQQSVARLMEQAAEALSEPVKS